MIYKISYHMKLCHLPSSSVEHQNFNMREMHLSLLVNLQVSIKLSSPSLKTLYYHLNNDKQK